MKTLLLGAILITVSFSYSQTTVYFGNNYGVKVISCSLNGVDIDFVFDTGASSSTLSKKDYSKLVSQNGEQEVVGRNSFEIASGDVVTSTTYIIDTLTIKDIALAKVKVDVLDSAVGSTLLGQNVFKRFKKYEIHPDHVVLYPKAYMGDDYYQRYDKTSLVELTIVTLEADLYLSFLETTRSDFQITESSFHIDEVDETVSITFDIMGTKTFNTGDLSALSLYQKEKNYSSEMTAISLYESLVKSRLGESIIEDLIRLNIEELRFNWKFTWDRGMNQQSVKVFTDQFKKGKTIGSYLDIKVY